MRKLYRLFQWLGEQRLARQFPIGSTVLDLGCGDNSFLQNVHGVFSTGIDSYKPYIEVSRLKGIHNRYILADLKDFRTSIPYDIVIAFEVLEHLEKRDALMLLNRMERWARHRVIITTPNGYQPNAPSGPNAEAQRHRCGFSPAELRARGYWVGGREGLKCFLHWRDKGDFKRGLYHASQLIAFHFPNWAVELIAIKNYYERYGF